MNPGVRCWTITLRPTSMATLLGPILDRVVERVARLRQ